MCGQAFPIFLALLSACALFTLAIFSAPFIDEIYFLRSDFFGGVRFGVLGWCIDATGVCSSKQFGYHFDPYLTPTLTILHVFYPIAAGFSLITALTLIPIIFSRHRRIYPFPLFSILSLLTFLIGVATLAITLAAWVTAMGRFHQNGFTGKLGPAIWMTVAAVVVLLIVAVNAECGMLCRGHPGRRRSHIIYTF